MRKGGENFDIKRMNTSSSRRLYLSQNANYGREECNEFAVDFLRAPSYILLLYTLWLPDTSFLYNLSFSVSKVERFRFPL